MRPKNKMISFKILSSKEDAASFLGDSEKQFASKEAYEEALELLFGYFELDDDGAAEIAVTFSCGCLLVRICTDEYAFLCPIPVGDAASVSGAAEEIRRYAVKEEIPLTFIDVREEELADVSEPFRFTDVYPMDEDGEVFAVAPMTEAAGLGGLPTVDGEKIRLSVIDDNDISDYAALCRHSEVNKLYGNDYTEDYGDAPDPVFFKRMQYEVESGMSMTFAIRYENKFAGEAVIFGFDYVGGAKVAIRLLPDFWGKGIGSEALELILAVAREIDLKRVSTAVKKENSASIRMTGKYMNYKCDEGDTALFEIEF